MARPRYRRSRTGGTPPGIRTRARACRRGRPGDQGQTSRTGCYPRDPTSRPRAARRASIRTEPKPSRGAARRRGDAEGSVVGPGLDWPFRFARQPEGTVATKFVYDFNEGNRDMKDLLGGKGANLAEMTNIGLPVPPGFTITTQACLAYLREGRFPEGLMKECDEHLGRLEKAMGKGLGHEEDPLL